VTGAGLVPVSADPATTWLMSMYVNHLSVIAWSASERGRGEFSRLDALTRARCADQGPLPVPPG